MDDFIAQQLLMLRVARTTQISGKRGPIERLHFYSIERSKVSALFS
jgi:hypothetical protein